MTRFIASALLAVASIGTATAAGAVVPGSDTYERARDNAAVQSVIEGSRAAPSAVGRGGTTAYGYPNASTGRASSDLVPGSSYFDDEADSRAVTSVITGTPQGTVDRAPAGSGRLVPGSDSY